MPGQPAAGDGSDADASRLPAIIARLSSDDDDLDNRARAGLLGRLTAGLAGSARRAGAAAVASGRWLTDVVVDLAPYVPVRDVAALQERYPDLSRDEIASALVAAAARATAAVGAAGGVLSSVELTAPPLLLTSPVQLAAETVSVVGIELKLVAELHELYGQAPAGTPSVRAAAYLGAWTRRRGLDPLASDSRLSSIVGGAAKRQLRRRLLRRAGSNASTMLPFLAGAVAGATLNRRETQSLGAKLIDDLSSPPTAR